MHGSTGACGPAGCGAAAAAADGAVAAAPCGAPTEEAAHAPDPPPAGRPLLVVDDPDVLDELLRLAAATGTEVDVAADPAAARRCWRTAPLVVVAAGLRRGARAAAGCRAAAASCCSARAWTTPACGSAAVEAGAERVVFLPDAEDWLTARLADAAEAARARAPSSPSSAAAAVRARRRWPARWP